MYMKEKAIADKNGLGYFYICTEDKKEEAPDQILFTHNRKRSSEVVEEIASSSPEKIIITAEESLSKGSNSHGAKKKEK